MINIGIIWVSLIYAIHLYDINVIYYAIYDVALQCPVALHSFGKKNSLTITNVWAKLDLPLQWQTNLHMSCKLSGNHYLCFKGSAANGVKVWAVWTLSAA